MNSLLLTVRFHDERYHGVPDWPPSPARLFQALVAAAARGASLSPDAKTALEWLETLEAPVIAAPHARRGEGFNNFVPNNDLDAVGGDVRRIGGIRAAKRIHPWLFDSETPLLYAWKFEESGDASARAKEICEIALDLFQLGRGVDMAWASGEILANEALSERLAGYPGVVQQPSKGVGGMALACPQRGSLASLIDRHKRTSERFENLTAPAPTKKEPNKTKAAGQLFKQPPKARFRQVGYDCPPVYLLFDLQGADARWSQAKIAALTERIRDHAAQRLAAALPDKTGCIDKVIIGRNATETDKAARIRIIPLPSIRHAQADHAIRRVQADHAIRRVLIEIPPNCPLPVGDIEWAFSGLEIAEIDASTGEVLVEGPTLASASSRTMLGHYGVEAVAPSRFWRTVTPAALPAARWRIDPKRLREEANCIGEREKKEAKDGAERAKEEGTAAGAVLQALRQAGITAPVASIRVQREPLNAKGERAETFAPGTRFPKERLWHAEIAFGEGVSGPLVIGDGRYLGLGLMRPMKEAPEQSFVFDIAGDKPIPADRRIDFLRAVRRALMALDRDHGEGERVSRFFSGHEEDGAPARSGTHEHVFLAATGVNRVLSRLFVLSPNLADRRTRLDCADQARFSEIARKLKLVRAGELGVVELVRARLDEDRSPLWASQEWRSETPYIPTRHIKSKDEPAAWLKEDILRECARRGIPRPEVEILSFEAGGKSRPNANLKLIFKTPIKGPILLGQGAHFGSGLFCPGVA